MKAVLCKQYGPPETLVVEDVPSPRAGPGECACDADDAVDLWSLSMRAADGVTGLVVDAVDEHRPDMILLDWKMPGMTGIEVLRELRRQKIEVPVVFLTVLSDQIYEEAGLLGGAVDFIEKSRSFSILSRRVELIINGFKGREVSKGQGQAQAQAHQPLVVKQGNIHLRCDVNRAYWKDSRIDLTLTEFRIVEYLVRRAGQDIRYRELYDIVHGAGFAAGEGEIGFRANVRAFVKRIRQKFRDVDPVPCP